MLGEALAEEGWAVETVRDGADAVARLRKGTRYAAVLTDLRLPGADGLEVLEAAREVDPLCPVIMMTGYGTVEVAVEAMKSGAWDFVQKPVDIDRLVLQLQRASEHRNLTAENALLRDEESRRVGLPEIVGDSPRILDVAAQVRKVAPTDATVMLRGESGTGKELVARAIHALSDRAHRSFVAINCAAIPETLIESELFGHEKGAFTGATARQQGKFELADGGTIFLDEIGDMSLGAQAKLLRVLEERQFERVGGRLSIEVDIRVVCATNADLESGVSEGRFREDLLFRVQVFPIEIPPLRERSSDVAALARHFVDRHSRKLGKEPMTISAEALAALERYEWPGNVRELENCLERAVILTQGSEIGLEDLFFREQSRVDHGLDDLLSRDRPLAELVREATRRIESARIARALRDAPDRESAAEALGISARTLTSKIRDYEL